MDANTPVIEKLDEVIAALRAGSGPTADRWLDPAAAAAYLSIGKRQFLERIAVLPGFPTPLRVGHPRWKASEVAEWAEVQRRRSAA